jgi:hypothetical protein
VFKGELLLGPLHAFIHHRAARRWHRGNAAQGWWWWAVDVRSMTEGGRE